MAEYGLQKKERLSGKKIFTELFLSETSTVVFPYKIIWAEPSAESNIQFGVSIPKRNFKRAVARNTLKRKIKEAYRKHKHILITGLSKKKINVALLFIYLSKEEIDYIDIEKKMIVSLVAIVNHYTKQEKLL